MASAVDYNTIMDDILNESRRPPYMEPNPELRMHPIACNGCGNTEWKRTVTGTWSDVEYIDTTSPGIRARQGAEEDLFEEFNEWCCCNCEDNATMNQEQLLRERS